MKFNDLIELAEATNFNVGYSEEKKNAFIQLSRKYMKSLMGAMEESGQFSKIEFDYNKAGYAVSGEFTIQANLVSGGGVYVCLSFSPFSKDFGFYRATKGIKDYTGGKNQDLHKGYIKNPHLFCKRLFAEAVAKEAKSLADGVA